MNRKRILRDQSSLTPLIVTPLIAEAEYEMLRKEILELESPRLGE